MKRFFAVIGIVIAVLSASGCKEESAVGFVGRWTEQGSSGELKHPRLLSIAAESNAYLVDESIYLDGEYKVQREVAQPVSESVISVKNGMRNIRYENGALFYRNTKFVKAI